MNTPVKLAAFGVGLAAVFGAALGVGAAVGPVGPAVEETTPAEAPPAHDETTPGVPPHEEHGP
jgi:hypothetical protein